MCVLTMVFIIVLGWRAVGEFGRKVP
jgi:hypothetical protein